MPTAPLSGQMTRRLPRSSSGGRDTYVFRRQGDFWTICYAGRPILLRDGKGLRYLACLLANPNRDVVALALVKGTTPGRCLAEVADRCGLDGEGSRARVARLDDLRHAILEAEQMNDRDRVLQARERLDALAVELWRTLGFSDDGRAGGAALERARSGVRKRISAAIEQLHAGDAGLAMHLRGTVSTGFFCSYRPAPDARINWQL
jgi:non-specific serine/threonine protein kinase